MSIKKVAIFGSTGSIGVQTLDVIRAFPGEFEVVALTAQSREAELNKQAEEFGARSQLGLENLDELVASADYIINAVPGFDGLAISLAAVRAGKVLLSANKESLAIAGKYLRAEAEQFGAKIYPLDSEASAIWQLMHEHGVDKISSVTLTCSGGPFFGKTAEELKNVTVQEALNHPTWKMGPKVSLDSATLINKVLEVYETHFLFDIPLKDIHIRVHPQSLVHGMIHTKTGATKMHITQNDMKLFISYALHYPNQPKFPWGIERKRRSEMDFMPPDPQTFRSLQWLERHAGNPNFPIALNALNDIATARFLKGEMKFLEIYDFIEAGLEEFLWEVPPQNLDELLEYHHRVTQHYEHRNTARSGQVHSSGTQQAVG